MEKIKAEKVDIYIVEYQTFNGIVNTLYFKKENWLIPLDKKLPCKWANFIDLNDQDLEIK